ncbi:MAG: molybdenum cofactor biosynthesis protein MoaE [Hyphomicrobiaceae bacterium]|nr:molybdenum cofactor biosynthesis protein MoaE [Hyphomicrobiaceae bacterium]
MAVRIDTVDFNIANEIKKLTANRSDIGAIVTFTGTVRGATKSGPLASMTLEHYPGMTERELSTIELEAKKRWPLTECAIVHRVGTLLPGENIVLVITASTHRHAAFEAAEFLMDYLKTRAPFWKKETLRDGTAAWVDAREVDETAIARWQTT